MSTLFTNVYKKSDLGQHSLTLLFLKHFFSCVSFLHFDFMCDLKGCKSFVGWKTSLSLQLSMQDLKVSFEIVFMCKIGEEKKWITSFFSHFLFEAKRKDVFFLACKGWNSKICVMYFLIWSTNFVWFFLLLRHHFYKPIYFIFKLLNYVPQIVIW
jgi:hypothetical protein